MNADLKSLSKDSSISKQDVVDLAIKYKEEIHYLNERIRLLQNELFGRKSEKSNPSLDRQLPIFEDEPQMPPTDTDTVTIAAHNRKKRGRKPLPGHLPRVEIVHDIDEADKICGCGQRLSRIGEDTCEKLDYIPAKVRVERHVRPKYACKACEGVEDDGPTVKIAPTPPALIPKSIATATLLAYIGVSKFADGLPLYRLSKIFARIQVDLSRATMAGWLIKAAQRLSPLLALLENEIRGGPLINIDESPLQVLKEPGRKNTTKSYMWVFCGGSPEKPTVLYRYQPTRSGEAALNFLDGYQGYIQSDDFVGYDYLGKKDGIIHLGCMAHVRRKFHDVVKVRKKQRGKRKASKGYADQALDYIGQLYRIEKLIRQEELSPEQIFQLRQDKSKPVLKQFKKWLDATKPLTPPQGLLGRAIAYALNNWSKLIVYVNDALLKPDNNRAENALRPFVVGRKAWLFAGSPAGAHASATFFSLIETAKANGLEPYAYLRYLFDRLPHAHDEKDFRALLPQHVDTQSMDQR